ncbi:hypothetical protein RND81_05G176300 [Saponaria officinalis]|uniref:Uncharacterized protein n=1 Tax=Saponaria officinalis TaxID=3572 RepID=A0AAW1KZP8_SAPOF
MAFNSKTFLALATLLLLATSQAHGLAIVGVSVTTCVVVVGLHCQVNPAGVVSGNAAPLTDIVTTLLLNGQPIAYASTDLDGISKITLNSGALLSSILSLSSLNVRVTLPIASCSIWANTNGALLGPVVQVGSITNGVLTLVVNTLRVVA